VVQQFKFVAIPLKANDFATLTTTRSRWSVCRTQQRSSQELGNRKYPKLLFDVDTGYWSEELQDPDVTC
jgi:hypothetical protein